MRTSTQQTHQADRAHPAGAALVALLILTAVTETASAAQVRFDIDLTVLAQDFPEPDQPSPIEGTTLSFRIDVDDFSHPTLVLSESLYFADAVSSAGDLLDFSVGGFMGETRIVLRDLFATGDELNVPLELGFTSLPGGTFWDGGFPPAVIETVLTFGDSPTGIRALVYTVGNAYYVHGYEGRMQASIVPVPGAALLFLAALGGCACFRRRRRVDG